MELARQRHDQQVGEEFRRLGIELQTTKEELQLEKCKVARLQEQLDQSNEAQSYMEKVHHVQRTQYIHARY
jgi:hypothetical protein